MKTLPSFIHKYVSFNTFANEAYIQWLQSCDENFLTRKTGGKSIIKEIKHLKQVHHYWTSFIAGEDISLFQWSIPTLEMATELKEFQAASHHFETTVRLFTEDQLMEVIQFRAPWASNSLPRMDYILHNINHSTNHRGQIAALARCQGYEGKIPLTEYTTFIGN